MLITNLLPVNIILVIWENKMKPTSEQLERMAQLELVIEDFLNKHIDTPTEKFTVLTSLLLDFIIEYTFDLNSFYTILKKSHAHKISKQEKGVNDNEHIS